MAIFSLAVSGGSILYWERMMLRRRCSWELKVSSTILRTLSLIWLSRRTSRYEHWYFRFRSSPHFWLIGAGFAYRRVRARCPKCPSHSGPTCLHNVSTIRSPAFGGIWYGFRRNLGTAASSSRRAGSSWWFIHSGVRSTGSLNGWSLPSSALI